MFTGAKSPLNAISGNWTNSPPYVTDTISIFDRETDRQKWLGELYGLLQKQRSLVQHLWEDRGSKIRTKFLSAASKDAQNCDFAVQNDPICLTSRRMVACSDTTCSLWIIPSKYLYLFVSIRVSCYLQPVLVFHLPNQKPELGWHLPQSLLLLHYSNMGEISPCPCPGSGAKHSNRCITQTQKNP